LTAKHHYQVKVLVSGSQFYGLCLGDTCWSGDGSKKAKPGYVWVEEAITGSVVQVPEAMLVDIPLDTDFNYDRKTGRYLGDNEFEKFLDGRQADAEKIDKEAGAGIKVGRLFYTPVGDGSSCYVVTKVGKRNSTIEWRPFGGADRWVDRTFGYGGSVPNKMIEPYL